MITRTQSYTYVRMYIDRVDPCIPCTKQGRQVRCLVELFNQLDSSTCPFLSPSFPQPVTSSTPPFLNPSLPQPSLPQPLLSSTAPLLKPSFPQSLMWSWLKCSGQHRLHHALSPTNVRTSLMSGPGFDLDWQLQIRQLASNPHLWTMPPGQILERSDVVRSVWGAIIVLPNYDTCEQYRLIVAFGPVNPKDLERYYQDLLANKRDIIIDAQTIEVAISSDLLSIAIDAGSVFWKMRQCGQCGIVSRRMKRCDLCTTHYCGTICQGIDWLDHKTKCKKMQWKMKKWPSPHSARKALYMAAPPCPQLLTCTANQALESLQIATGTPWKMDEMGKVYEHPLA